MKSSRLTLTTAFDARLPLPVRIERVPWFRSSTLTKKATDPVLSATASA